MKRMLMALALTGLLAGCASYDDGQGGTGGVGSDRTFWTGSAGETDLWTQTNSFHSDAWLEPYGTWMEPQGRMGDSAH